MDVFRPILSETIPQIILPNPLRIAYVAIAVPAMELAHATVSLNSGFDGFNDPNLE